MAESKIFEKEKKDFRAMCQEVLPLIEEIHSILMKYGVSDMAQITTDADGYMNFCTGDNGWEMIRIALGRPAKIRYSYSEEVFTEKSGHDV